jgi:hypothetical protein
MEFRYKGHEIRIGFDEFGAYAFIIIENGREWYRICGVYHFDRCLFLAKKEIDDSMKKKKIKKPSIRAPMPPPSRTLKPKKGKNKPKKPSEEDYEDESL